MEWKRDKEEQSQWLQGNEQFAQFMHLKKNMYS